MDDYILKIHVSEKGTRININGNTIDAINAFLNATHALYNALCADRLPLAGVVFRTVVPQELADDNSEVWKLDGDALTGGSVIDMRPLAEALRKFADKEDKDDE